MPNTPETVIAMLASTSIGASWSCCSPDFGTAGILDRFVQIGPKVLFTTDGYVYKGKTIALRHVADVVTELPELRKLVEVPYLQNRAENSHIAMGVRYADFVGQGATPALDFAQLPFDHPAYILYSSGTTGKPKCIVHGAGGTLLQHLKELVLHTDVKPDDRVFYYTTTGWMMWNWLVSSLAVGATVVLYEGSPFYPSPQSLFDLVEQEGVSIFGTSAKYLSAIEKTGLQPTRTHDLMRLKTILSTGSPLAPESFDYVYRNISVDVQLSSISGGTDIVSCFALGNPLLPVHRGELQCRGLGMKVEVYNEQGESVRAQKGELVCTRPFPSMPVYFWNDPHGEKYTTAYFEKYPSVWAHGDYAELTPHGGLIVYGRSDAALNPRGVCIGTAEIYRQVEALPEVLESLAIGQEWHDDIRIVLFVKLRDGVPLNDALRGKIKTTIRANTSPRHVPAKIIQVAELPRTVSGKLVELAVREVVHNRPVKNVDALANPEALELFSPPPRS